MKILAVDDSQNNLMLLNVFLSKAGHQVESAQHGEEAVDKVRQGSFDLVLMDVLMPVMDGIDACRAIREWEKAQGRDPLPILALSAANECDNKENCRQAGFTDFLAKPFRRPELIETVEKYGGSGE